MPLYFLDQSLWMLYCHRVFAACYLAFIYYVHMTHAVSRAGIPLHNVAFILIMYIYIYMYFVFGMPRVLKPVGGKEGHAPYKIFIFQQILFLCQVGFMAIVRLSQS